MAAMKEDVLALLRIWSCAEGAELCDRCGETIWPEIELVRCDYCVGKHGPPQMERIQEAAKRCAPRIRMAQAEMWDDECARVDDDQT